MAKPWIVCGRGSSIMGRKLDLAATISFLNKEHVNNRVYVSLMEADPGAMIADKVMPTLPLSIMNVMDGMRGTQDMVVSNESSVNETATSALDYVVCGSASADDKHQISHVGAGVPSCPGVRGAAVWAAC